MKLKKLLALLLAMMMAFALVACGDTADTGDDAAEDEEQTEGTYSLSEDGGTMKIEVGGVTYAGTFIDKDGHTVMVAMLDGTGMNALYFQEIIEG